VAAERVPNRGWKRVITRTRAFFKSRTAPVERTGFSAVRPGESVQSQAVGSAEPPPVENPGLSVPESAGPSVLENPEPSVPEGAGPSAPARAGSSVPARAQPSVRESPERPLPEVETAEVREQVDVETSIDPQEVLSAALESLGQAHHRPFSRS
jgi:hypothetical protein